MQALDGTAAGAGDFEREMLGRGRPMTDQPRVILGTHDSLTGLRALREAVAAARQRGVELCAVRAYDPPRPLDQGGTFWPTAPPCAQRSSSSHEQAIAFVNSAFAAAMGGLPADLPVRIRTGAGPAHHVLADAVAGERDLLVVGATRRRRWWRPCHRSVSGYCASRVSCALLVVPPARAARELGGCTLRWWRVRVRRELAQLADPVLSDAG